LFTAVPWKSGGGGCLAVVNAYKFKKYESDIPLIRGHQGPIVDFEFSPFNDYLLSTASEDGTIKLWIIPEEGITHDVSDSDAELRGHAKKLIFAKFHPCADYTIASAAADMTLRIWDVANQRCVMTYEDVKSTATGLEWSHDGSLLAMISKDKQLVMFDPRKEGQAMITNTHEGARP
jgi:coronin-1B/1C/6